MKAKKFSILGLLSMLLLGVGSCSNDDLTLDTNKPLEADQTFYLNIAVNGTMTGTRAGEIGDYGTGDEAYNPEDEPNFSEGTDVENKVKQIHLVFYDATRKRLSTENPPISQLNQSNGSNPSENQIYSGVVQVDVKRGENIPAYVLCFINPSDRNFMKDEHFATLDEVEKYFTTNFINDNSFAMSNSVYYGYDPVTLANNVRIMATPITSFMLFDSKQKAEKALAADPKQATVDIYVERYAGKVDFAMNNDGINDLKAHNLADEEITLKFIPEYWAVNAVEDQSYVTKNYFAQAVGSTDFDFTKPASFETMNSFLNWYWNSSDFHRSYWGQSPGYYIGTYPRVSDDIMDEDGWTVGSKGNIYELKYYSYNELAEEVDKNGAELSAFARKVGATAPGSIYSRENTVSGAALGAAAINPLASPMAAIASVVMVGHYEARKAGNLLNDEIFYITVNNSGETPEYTYYNLHDMKKTFLINTISLAYSEDGKNLVPINAENIATYEDYFEVKHPVKDVRQELVMDSRTVSLQLADKAKGKIYARIGDDYHAVTEENMVEINRMILSSAGTSYGFSSGKAYFSIPIQHLGYYRADNVNKNVKGGANNEEFKWYNRNDQKEIYVKSGDFGIVRNHAYKIEVSLVNGLGNGIPNPDDPIVPPTNPEEYYIGARIVVLNWAIVPTQSVEL